MKRPKSVTVIAWIIIVRGCMGLLFVVNFARQQLSGGSVLLIPAAAIVIVSSIAILKGLNWGRLLYLFYIPIVTVYSLIMFVFGSSGITGIAAKLSFIRFILEIIFYVVVLVYLTRPAASAFFAHRKLEGKHDGRKDGEIR